MIMAAVHKYIAWTCSFLVIMLCVDHAQAAVGSIWPTSSKLTKRAASCDVMCPRENEPESYTECCILEDDTVKCCSGHVAFHVDDSLVKVVGITVISTCVFLAILILTCCFWSRCPLYNTCRVDYGQTDEVPYCAKEDHPLTGGDLALAGRNAPRGFAVSVKPVEEV